MKQAESKMRLDGPCRFMAHARKATCETVQRGQGDRQNTLPRSSSRASPRHRDAPAAEERSTEEASIKQFTSKPAAIAESVREKGDDDREMTPKSKPQRRCAACWGATPLR